jgi:acyl-CoA reductase-like NAD-dependent aldehyde dehydrogenase
MGGFKCSGIGREAGVEGLEIYTEAKSIGIPGDAVGGFEQRVR